MSIGSSKDISGLGAGARVQQLFSPARRDTVPAQLVRYFFVGGAAALVDWSLYWFLVSLAGFHYFYAAVVSFIAATLVNYALSVLWVFKAGARFGRLTELGLVFMVSAAGLAINQLSLVLLIERFSLHFMAAKVAATAVVFFWNFLLRRYYIFKGQEA